MILLEIEKLSAYYGMARSLHEVSLKVGQGEIVGIIGANGAGKSTLLDSIAGMTKTTGSIRFDGEEINSTSTANIISAGIGYAPERANLFAYMSVEDNLKVGGYTAREELAANLDRVYDLFPNLTGRKDQETSTQSGGERQMVSVGRALMSNPKLLLIDEPTIGLSPKVCEDIAAALRRLNKERGLTIVITEQNVNFALTLAERLYVLETGEIRLSGTADELRSDPALNEAYFGH